MRPIPLIINSSSGPDDSADVLSQIESEFAANGMEIAVRQLDDGEEIESVLEDESIRSAESIIIAGGDGTVSAAANAATSAGQTLGILPQGTLNNFAKDLGIPVDIGQAVKVISDAYSRKVDLAEVNGRSFINNSSIGLYPSIVRRRDVQQERLGRGKWFAAFLAAWQVTGISPFYTVRFCIGEKEFVRKTPFVFIGNNGYEMDLYNIGRRATLDGGKLSVYILLHGGRWGVFRLLIKTILGLLKHATEFEAFHTESITISTKTNHILVAMDGEVTSMTSPLEYMIKPRALDVLVPEPED